MSSPKVHSTRIVPERTATIWLTTLIDGGSAGGLPGSPNWCVKALAPFTVSSDRLPLASIVAV